jgi:hypothetical protein
LELRKKIKPLLKKILSVVGWLLIISIILWMIGFLFAEPFLEKQIRETFRARAGGKYLLDFDDFSIAYRNRGIQAENLRLYVNPDSLESFKNQDLFSFSCKQIQINKPHWISILFKGKIAAEEVRLKEARLTMNRSRIRPKKNEDKKQTFEGVEFYRILVNEGAAVIKEKESGRLLFSSPKFNLFCEDFSLSPGLIPSYRYFAFDGHKNAMTLFGGNELRIGDLFIAGGASYTGLNAAGLDIHDVDAPLRQRFKIGKEWQFSVERISLETPSLLRMIETLSEGNLQHLHMNKLLLTKPFLHYRTRKNPAPEPKAKNTEVLSSSKPFHFPEIERLGVYDGRILWTESGEKKPILSIRELDFTVTGIRSVKNRWIPIVYETCEIFSGPAEVTPAGWEYTFSAERGHYRSATDSLAIFGIKAMPHKSVDSFHLDKLWRIDRFEFTADTLLVSNTRLHRLGFDGTYSPDTVLFLNPVLKSYTDKRLQHNPSYPKPYPVEILRNIPGKFDIKLIECRNAKAEYSEKVSGTPGIGTLRMEKGLLRVSGMKSRFSDKDTVILDYSCSFGGESRAKIRVVIPLVSEREIQYVNGEIHHLPFKTLNSITENTVLFGFSKGDLDSCRFRFFAENGKSFGTSYFYYTNLRVKIYKVMDVPAYGSKILIGKGFLTLAANLLINKNNPTPQQYSIAGPIEFKRDKLKGPLNFWVKSIMTGLVNTAVEDISDLKDLQGEISELKTSSQSGLLSKIKSDPEKRKARRVAREARKAMSAGEKK